MSIEDDCIIKYINEYYSENFICEHENKILMMMEMRQKESPSEKNDNEWQAFSDFICKRRTGKLENND